MRKRKSKRTPGMEEARPFAGMSQINEGAAGVDISAQEIMVCVPGSDGTTQIVKSFGTYTVDLQAIGHWLTQQQIKTVATPAPTAGAVWKAPASIGYRCLKNSNDRDSSVC